MTVITKHKGARGTKVFCAPITPDQGKFILLAASRAMPLITRMPDVAVYLDKCAYTSNCRTCFAGSLRAVAYTARELTRWKTKNKNRLSDTALGDLASAALILRDLLLAADQDQE